MRITDETRFPHPVLSGQTGDFLEGAFEISFTGRENLQSGGLVLEHDVTLTEPTVRQLVQNGDASVGCFVRCNDTYYTALLRMSWPAGRTDFAPGDLLNRVTLQPMVWLDKRLPGWNPTGVNSEFELPIDLEKGELIAVGPMHVMSIGQAKLAPLESIFELRRAEQMEEGRIELDPNGDRIAILVAPASFDVIDLLRGQSSGRPVVMNAVYLPAVMEMLDLLRGAGSSFEGYRWYAPFAAKCDALGISLTDGMSTLDGGQRVLELPLRTLSILNEGVA